MARKIPWRKLALGVLTAALGGYVLALAILFFDQRNLLYHPTAAGAPANSAGLGIQKVRIDTADGEHLVGWWLPPRADLPTFLFFNGNTAGLDGQGGRWKRLAKEGTGFLAIAYRGYDGSTGHPTEEGLHQDALAAYGWLAQRVPPKDIVIHGFSLGTGVAVRLATEKPARALILEAPYTSTVDVAVRQAPWAPVRLLMLDRFPSKARIREVKMPILIVHGDADSVIPIAQGQELFSTAPQPKQFVRMRGSDHNTLTRDGLYDHIWQFLRLPCMRTTAYADRPVPSQTISQGI